MSTRIHNIIILSAVLITVLMSFSAVLAKAELSPQLAELMARGIDNDSLINVVVFMDNREIRKNVNKINGEEVLSRSQRIKAVSRNLKSVNVRGADGVEFYLNAHSSSEVVRHWIVPAFSATVSVAV
ncbi:MAG: hypothetical protein ACOYVF_01140, partial [Candidatus Zixiibacteriota bacterium]